MKQRRNENRKNKRKRQKVNKRAGMVDRKKERKKAK